MSFVVGVLCGRAAAGAGKKRLVIMSTKGIRLWNDERGIPSSHDWVPNQEEIEGKRFAFLDNTGSWVLLKIKYIEASEADCELFRSRMRVRCSPVTADASPGCYPGSLIQKRMDVLSGKEKKQRQEEISSTSKKFENFMIESMKSNSSANQRKRHQFLEANSNRVAVGDHSTAVPPTKRARSEEDKMNPRTNKNGHVLTRKNLQTNAHGRKANSTTGRGRGNVAALQQRVAELELLLSQRSNSIPSPLSLSDDSDEEFIPLDHRHQSDTQVATTANPFTAVNFTTPPRSGSSLSNHILQNDMEVYVPIVESVENATVGDQPLSPVEPVGQNEPPHIPLCPPMVENPEPQLLQSSPPPIVQQRVEAPESTPVAGVETAEAAAVNRIMSLLSSRLEDQLRNATIPESQGDVSFRVVPVARNLGLQPGEMVISNESLENAAAQTKPGMMLMEILKGVWGDEVRRYALVPLPGCRVPQHSVRNAIRKLLNRLLREAHQENVSEMGGSREELKQYDKTAFNILLGHKLHDARRNYNKRNNPRNQHVVDPQRNVEVMPGEIVPEEPQPLGPEPVGPQAVELEEVQQPVNPPLNEGLVEGVEEVNQPFENDVVNLDMNHDNILPLQFVLSDEDDADAIDVPSFYLSCVVCFSSSPTDGELNCNTKHRVCYSCGEEIVKQYSRVHRKCPLCRKAVSSVKKVTPVTSRADL